MKHFDFLSKQNKVLKFFFDHKLLGKIMNLEFVSCPFKSKIKTSWDVKKCIQKKYLKKKLATKEISTKEICIYKKYLKKKISKKENI